MRPKHRFRVVYLRREQQMGKCNRFTRRYTVQRAHTPHNCTPRTCAPILLYYIIIMPLFHDASCARITDTHDCCVLFCNYKLIPPLPECTYMVTQVTVALLLLRLLCVWGCQSSAVVILGRFDDNNRYLTFEFG